jgi:hypothetical protein
VRKMARGTTVQLRVEAEKVVERLVWTIWGRSGVSTRMWSLAGVGVGSDELRRLLWGFYRREGRDGGLGSGCWGKRDQGQTGGAAASLAPTTEECRRVEASRGASARFCGSVEDVQCAGRPTWLGDLSCTMERRPAGLPAMRQGRGGERREKMMGLMCRKQK